MAILPVITAPDPVLQKKAAPVESVSPDIVALMDDMLETMYESSGIGLAAPQVGISKRIIVVDIGDKPDRNNALFMANPEITWKSDEPFIYKEGCLSVPDLSAEVTRARSIKMKYLDRNGVSQELDASDLMAVCLQHEIDHLDGILFVDRLSALKRGMYWKKLKKMKKVQ